MSMVYLTDGGAFFVHETSAENTPDSFSHQSKKMFRNADLVDIGLRAGEIIMLVGICVYRHSSWQDLFILCGALAATTVQCVHYSGHFLEHRSVTFGVSVCCLCAAMSAVYWRNTKLHEDRDQFSAEDDGLFFQVLSEDVVQRESEPVLPMDATKIEGPDIDVTSRYKLEKVTADGAVLRYVGRLIDTDGIDNTPPHTITMRNNSYNSSVVFSLFLLILLNNIFAMYRLVTVPSPAVQVNVIQPAVGTMEPPSPRTEDAISSDTGKIGD